MMATAKAPMLMKPAISGGEAPPEKNAPGCWGGDDSDDDDDDGKGTTVVVVVGPGGTGFESVDTVAAEIKAVLASDNGFEGGKEGRMDDMADSQEGGSSSL